MNAADVSDLAGFVGAAGSLVAGSGWAKPVDVAISLAVADPSGLDLVAGLLAAGAEGEVPLEGPPTGMVVEGWKSNCGIVLMSTAGALDGAGDDSAGRPEEVAGAELVVAIGVSSLAVEPMGTVDEGLKSKVGIVLVSIASDAVGRTGALVGASGVVAGADSVPLSTGFDGDLGAPVPVEPTGTVDDGWKSKLGIVLVSIGDPAPVSGTAELVTITTSDALAAVAFWNTLAAPASCLRRLDPVSLALATWEGVFSSYLSPRFSVPAAEAPEQSRICRKMNDICIAVVLFLWWVEKSISK